MSGTTLPYWDGIVFTFPKSTRLIWITDPKVWTLRVMSHFCNDAFMSVRLLPYWDGYIFTLYNLILLPFISPYTMKLYTFIQNQSTISSYIFRLIFGYGYIFTFQKSIRLIHPIFWGLCIDKRDVMQWFLLPPFIHPLMPTGAFNICCPRDCVSRTANVERTVRH